MWLVHVCFRPKTVSHLSVSRTPLSADARVGWSCLPEVGGFPQPLGLAPRVRDARDRQVVDHQVDHEVNAGGREYDTLGDV